MVGIRMHNGNQDRGEAGSLEHRDARRVARTTTKLVSQSQSQSQYHQNTTSSYLAQSQYRHESTRCISSQSQYRHEGQSVSYLSSTSQVSQRRQQQQQQCPFLHSRLLDDGSSLSDGLVLGSHQLSSDSSEYFNRSRLLPEDIAAFYPESLLSDSFFDGSHTSSSRESLFLHLERGNRSGPPSIIVSDADEGDEGKLEMS